MLDRDQELALQTLAHSIRGCIETMGPACTARLLGTITLDLIEGDAYTEEGAPSQPLRGGQDSADLQPAVSSHHLGASQTHRRPAGHPSTATR